MRRRRRQFLLSLGAALGLAAAMIAASQLSARGDSGAPAPAAEKSTISSAFEGIPQRGNVLGRRTAPVTLVEYADLQCPYCAEWAARTLPLLVSDYVRTGKLRIVFRGLAFLGPDSHLALQTAIAAGRHRHLWDVVEGLYTRQGSENTGWVTDTLLDEVTSAAGLDYDALVDERSQASVHQEIQTTATTAALAGVSGTPSFELGRTGERLRLVRLQSLGPEGLVPAIDALLR